MYHQMKYTIWRHKSQVRVSFDMPEYTGDTTGLGTIRILEAMRKTNSLKHVFTKHPPVNFTVKRLLRKTKKRRLSRKVLMRQPNFMLIGSLAIIGTVTGCSPVTVFSSIMNLHRC